MSIETKKAFVFPGQGSQRVGMGKEIYENFLSARDVFDEINDSLSKNLSNIIFNGPLDELTLTENAQPSIMCVSMAIIRILQKDFKINLKNFIDLYAGHSLGEYTALAAADSISLADTAKILYFRGRKMQEASSKSKTAMAAFMGADIEEIKKILNLNANSNEICDIANYNTETQIVLSGDETAIDRAIEYAIDLKIRSVKLKVSAPFHSSYMKSCADDLKKEFLKYQFKLPNIKIVSNFKAKPFDDINDIIDSLYNQTFSTVKWYDSIKYMSKKNVNTYNEIGYGNTLSGIIKRIDKSFIIKNISTAKEIEIFAKEIK